MKFAYSGSRLLRRSIFLALDWTAGLCAGAALFLTYRDSFCALVQQYSFDRVSLAAALLPLFLPFALSAAACVRGRLSFLFGIAFCRAFSFSFAFTGFLIAFPASGWLIRLLLGFGGLCSAPVLYLFWLRCLSAGRSISASSLLLFAAAFLLLGSVYYCLVMPFAAGL